ncbi:MAG TPA: ankyrin repeat domain-containing protein [Chthonomonadaceae bacterium]|nr:ankyrin repeat domain-containing protein [Chthonomonadaceae bacterium]
MGKNFSLWRDRVLIVLFILVAAGIGANRLYRNRMPERLLQAAQHGDTVTVESLLKQGIDPNLNLNGHTPLTEAVRSGSGDTVDALLRHGARPNDTLVAYALFQQRPEIARRLLAQDHSLNGENFMPTAPSGYTLLMNRAANGDAEGVQMLLKAGANVNRTLQGYTALMEAARIGRNDIVKMLLQRGADVNMRANDGTTALRIAIRQRHPDTARLLKQAGASR